MAFLACFEFVQFKVHFLPLLNALYFKRIELGQIDSAGCLEDE